MFDDIQHQNNDVVKFSQDDDIMNSQEKVTELPEFKRSELPMNALDTIGLPVGLTRPPLEMIRPPRDIIKSQLDIFSLIRTQMNDLDLVTSSTVFNTIQPQLDTLGTLKSHLDIIGTSMSSMVADALQPQLDTISMITSSMVADALHSPLDIIGTSMSSMVADALQFQLDTLSMMTPSLNVFNVITSSWTGIADSFALLTAEMSRTFRSFQSWTPYNFKHLEENYA